MKVFQQVRHLPEFAKDLKKLLKRFKTLEEDLENFIDTQLNLYHKLRIDNGGIVKIQGLPQREGVEVFKARKFACRSLKGKGVQSGIRIIYAFRAKEDFVDLIEIYYKGDQENEDRERITRYLESA